MSTDTRLHVEQKQGSVESWEYDEVTDVSSDPPSFSTKEHSTHHRRTLPTKTESGQEFKKAKARLLLREPLLNTEGEEELIMEREKSDSPGQMEDQEENDLVSMIQPFNGNSHGPGMANIPSFANESHFLGPRDIDEEDEDDRDEAEEGRSVIPSPDLMGISSGREPEGTDVVAYEPNRLNSASLVPPPHLMSTSIGGGFSTPSPEIRNNHISNPIDENSEDEENPAVVTDIVDNDDEEGMEENDVAIDGDNPGGAMNHPGPGAGHRLDTLDLGSGGPGGPGAQTRQDDEEDDDDDEDDDGQGNVPEGAYDPAEYENLNVSPEIRELFSFITNYTPQAIELEHRLRPYIPDYIPAVGDIDAFIKILPPDNSETKVGLTELDEPSARQSDATVLDLQLRSLAKHTTTKTLSIKTVESADKNPKVIEKWVRDISDLHRAKPAPTVHYSKRMPDIDSLMQEWPGELEDLFQELRLPNAALDLDLENYAGLICAILDIPVYKSKIQSLHVLFTLYSEFRNSVHFRRLAEDNYMDNEQGERLVID
ncbi:intraflagellar transport protein 46 isoform X1 [Hyalella azteca]|uniref:Intraflagellar transport protein 46 homolog n=3 Tax=Hyalella azteca TaxID=294128 RepID=A0A8B7N1A9_HYAAZ|nr:intraflagellar transport protein 46 isoform X1 [Hyalella azteca]